MQASLWKRGTTKPEQKYVGQVEHKNVHSIKKDKDDNFYNLKSQFIIKNNINFFNHCIIRRLPVKDMLEMILLSFAYGLPLQQNVDMQLLLAQWMTCLQINFYNQTLNKTS